MNVVRFHHRDIISREVVHNFSQILVDSRENSYSQTKIGRPEQSLSSLGTKPFHLFTVAIHPSGTARYQLHPCCKSLHIIIVCHCRISELNSHIRRFESFGVKIFLIINIYNTHNLMSAGNGNLFDFLTHLSVSN